jgi:hypothetical protein
MYIPPISPGSWGREAARQEAAAPVGFPRPDFSVEGDLVSLEANLSSYEFVKKLWVESERNGRKPPEKIQLMVTLECSEEQALERLINRLGIDPDNPQVAQKRSYPGWNESPFAFPSSPAFDPRAPDPRAAEVIRPRPWPEVDLVSLPFLGRPDYLFTVKDSSGKTRQHIGHWNTNGKHPFLHSFTLWHLGNDRLSERWMDLLPSRPVAPYLLERAEAFPDARVIVIDDCERCDAINKELRRRQPRDSIVSVAWAAGLAGTTPSDTDWTALAGRRLICVAMSDKISIRHAIDLLETLRENGVNDPTFKVCSESDLMGEPANLLDAVLAAEDLSADRFMEVAGRLYSIAIVPKTARHGWKPGEPLPQPEADYILSPLIKKGTITLLHSAPGAGKTWLAAIMGYFAAAGSTFLDLWHAEKPHKVLFLRTEATDTLPACLKEIHRTFGLAAALQNVEVYPSKDFSTTLNLGSEVAWERIARLVDDADLIVIDHLTNVTSGGFDPGSWNPLVQHLRRQTRRGKSILLLHHTGTNDRQLGTTKHLIDIDVEISMRREPGVRDRVQVEFGKVRDTVNLGEDFKPFMLHWKKDPQTDKIRWRIEYIEGKDKANWTKPPEVDPVPARVINEAYLAAHFGQDEVRVLRCLATAFSEGKHNMPRADIEQEVGVKKSKLLEIFRKLKTAGNIVASGQSKAFRYRLSDKMLQDVFQQKVMDAT